MLTISKASATRGNLQIIGSLGAFIVLGVLSSTYPLTSLACIGAIAIIILLVVLIRKLVHVELWQILVLIALTGYVVLNYGFANLAFHVAGVPIIIGHGLMLTALSLAALRHRRLFLRALRDPAMVCISILIAMALFRLLFDFPQFGFYAVRDASICTEGVFLLPGLMWGMERRSTSILMKWLMFLFVTNLVYSYTFVIAEELKAWSPKTGIFLEVPLFGTYSGNDCYLLAGALFCILLGRHTVRWPRFALVGLALMQLLGLALLQARAEYLSLLVCLCFLAMLGQIRKLSELIISLSFAMILLLVLTTVLGLEISGRVGPVNLDFLRDHASSLLGKRYAPATGSIEDREDWYGQVWGRLRSDPAVLLIGEGFGKPLIDAYAAGVATRQPHNSNLTVLARMGVLGLIVWLVFHFFILKRFAHVFGARAKVDRESFTLVLWLFLLYTILMIDTSVQPGLEFSNGAIPFYFLLGFALSVMRFQLNGTPRKGTSLQAAPTRISLPQQREASHA